MSSSAVRRVKESSGGGGGAKVTTVPPSKTSRSTTPLSERIICRGGDSVNMTTGKENANSGRPTSRIRTTAKPQKPLVPPIVRADKDSVEQRARWSTSSSVRPRGRSQSPSEFVRVTNDVRKTRVSRVSVDRNERSVSVDRSARVSDRVGLQNKGSSKKTNSKSTSANGVPASKVSIASLEKSSEICKESNPKPTVKPQYARVFAVSPKSGKQRDNNTSHPEISNTQSSSDSFVKVSESVKLFEKFKSKSSVGLKSSNSTENEEISVRSSFRDSGGKLSSRGSTSDASKEKGTSEDTLTARSNAKYPSKLHGKLAFLEEKVKRIASDIKRTKEMLDLNNPDASKVMLSDIQETVAGIEKAMGDVVNVETEKKGDDNNLQVIVTKTSPIKELTDAKSSSKGLNPDELEARFFPHHKLLRDRTTKNHETLKSEVALAISETKHELSDSLSNSESKVTIRGNLEICEVQETDSSVNQKSRESFYSGKGNVESMLTADETFEESDDQENKGLMIYEDDVDDSFNNELNEIGHKTCTGGWFVSEGESVLLAHDDGSCTFYDVANSEEKSVYKAPAEVSPNLWRDCWILRAPGADGCSGRYVVAASAGNSPESGFCSWDFYTKEVKSLHLEDGNTTTTTRTALAPLPNNVLNRRHEMTNLPPENRQWWYKPCGPLMISTASNQRGVRVFDIRDGEDVMKWELGSLVVGMENSSPLQWRNRGKVVVAEVGGVGLWDVASLTAEPLVSVNLNGKKILGLHVNNTDAELGGGVRQRVSSSEAEGNDGVFCTSDSINVLDFRNPSGIGIKIPKPTTTVHSIFSRGDSIYLGGSTATPPTARKPPSTAQIQHFSIRKQKLFTTYHLPESNSTAHHHHKAITQVWGDSSLTMAVSGLGLFVFDALKEDGMRPLMSGGGGDYGGGVKVRESVGPDNLYCPSFDYLGSRALVISRDRPAFWRYLA
ncbi:unnamed protein product [Lactuca saligna]|uniref:At4g14310 8-bladed propeller domain-containing protein n=1 Tax=Lactuca saligna TaxID=75948 RepID=A0AA35VSV5_LACSI|nr:unnamed protein product [Lactuca saligna]